MKILNNYNVGIYCRLSRDDHNGNLESMEYFKSASDPYGLCTRERLDFNRLLCR